MALYSISGTAVFHERSYANRAIIGYTTLLRAVQYMIDATTVEGLPMPTLRPQ